MVYGVTDMRIGVCTHGYMCVYINMYIYKCMYIYIYIYCVYVT